MTAALEARYAKQGMTEAEPTGSKSRLKVSLPKLTGSTEKGAAPRPKPDTRKPPQSTASSIYFARPSDEWPIRY